MMCIELERAAHGADNYTLYTECNMYILIHPCILGNRSVILALIIIVIECEREL